MDHVPEKPLLPQPEGSSFLPPPEMPLPPLEQSSVNYAQILPQIVEKNAALVPELQNVDLHSVVQNKTDLEALKDRLHGMDPTVATAMYLALHDTALKKIDLLSPMHTSAEAIKPLTSTDTGEEALAKGVVLSRVIKATTDYYRGNGVESFADRELIEKFPLPGAFSPEMLSNKVVARAINEVVSNLEKHYPLSQAHEKYAQLKQQIPENVQKEIEAGQGPQELEDPAEKFINPQGKDYTESQAFAKRNITEGSEYILRAHLKSHLASGKLNIHEAKRIYLEAFWQPQGLTQKILDLKGEDFDKEFKEYQDVGENTLQSIKEEEKNKSGWGKLKDKMRKIFL